MSTNLVAGSLRQSIIESEQERLDRIFKAWEYYLGDAKDVIRISPEGVNDNVRINLARVLVRKGVSWLLGADRSLPFALEENDTALQALDEAWPPELRAGVWNQLAINGGVTGHTFCRLMEKPIRVVVWDPSNVTVFWSNDDYEKVEEYRYEWVVEVGGDADPISKRCRVLNQDSSWLIVEEESTTSGDSWTEVARETWDRAWSPIFQCQNMPMPNEFWGEADLELDVLRIIDSIEGNAGGANKIVRHKGHQIPYVTGESAKNVKQIDVTIGQLLAIPNPSARMGQLEAARLEGVLEFYAKLWEAFHYVTRTPPIAFGIVNMSNVAEETVELAFAPAVEKTWDKRITYGPMMTDLLGRILELLGKATETTTEGTPEWAAGGASLRPQPQWPSIIPRSPGSQATELETDLRAGVVSKETASEKRGYEWADEKARMDQENVDAIAHAQKMFDAGGGGEFNPNDPGGS